MKIWVTGARGFIGRHLVAQAKSAGHDVWSVARRNASPSNDAEAPSRSIALDFGNHDEVAAEVRRISPDVIVHLAWHASPENYLVSIENVESLRNALSFARGALGGGCRRVIGVGSCVEYAELPRPRREDDAIDPQSLYARCKHAAHLVLTEMFAREGASLAWARLFHMHGPGEHPARLISAVVTGLRAGRPFSLSPGEQVRDHLDVRDIASALLHLATVDVVGPVNVCSGNPVTLRAVLEIVGRELGRADLLQFGARAYQPGEVMNLSGVATRLTQSGWRPAHGDLVASLRDAIAAVASP